ncbi:MAG: DUF2628 domain-containing protein [Pseudomonadota bacterium]
MKTYTVHMKAPSGDRTKDALDAVFIPEGFSLWAFLFPIPWMLINRMWLILMTFIVVTGFLEYGANFFGRIIPGVFLILATGLFAFEAYALRRWTIEGKGYRLVGIASGRSLADAEQRFFETWSDSAPGSGRIIRPMPTEPSGHPGRPSAERPVTGLFPRPEGAR